MYKGTYTLPKQHKRRSGISLTAVSFLLSWHVTLLRLGSICGDTQQHFSMSERTSHVRHCPSDLHGPEENVCPDIDLCVCSFWMLLVFFTASQWGGFWVLRIQITSYFFFFTKCNQNISNPIWIGLQGGTALLLQHILLRLSDLIKIFAKICWLRCTIFVIVVQEMRCGSVFHYLL